MCIYVCMKNDSGSTLFFSRTARFMYCFLVAGTRFPRPVLFIDVQASSAITLLSLLVCISPLVPKNKSSNIDQKELILGCLISMLSYLCRISLKKIKK